MATEHSNLYNNLKHDIGAAKWALRDGSNDDERDALYVLTPVAEHALQAVKNLERMHDFFLDLVEEPGAINWKTRAQRMTALAIFQRSKEALQMKE